MTSVLEASLFGHISDQKTLNRFLNRLKAIGSPVKDYFIHEFVLKPKEGSTIPSPVPSMKPVSLRVQIDQISNEKFISYFGVPEVNVNRKCTVLPVIQSTISTGDPIAFVKHLSFELEYELLRKGFESILGPRNELFIKIFQLHRIPTVDAIESAYPIEENYWIVQLGSDCENVQYLNDRDVLLHETMKIFDDLCTLQHLDNSLFMKS